MARFFPLTVINIAEETRDAVAVTLKPRKQDEAAFDFIQGQYLTFRKDFDGEELRRSYSICAGKGEKINGEPVLRVGIMRVEGGRFSNWANDNLTISDMLETMLPMGIFYTKIEPEKVKNYSAFVAGSGITLVLSIIKTVLEQQEKAQFTLIYANHQANSIMFREELEDLKKLYMNRFSLVNILKGEAQDIDLFAGRIDHEKFDKLCVNWMNLKNTDIAFIGGPEAMMLTVAEFSRSHILEAHQIKFVLFASPLHTNVKHSAQNAPNTQTSKSTCQISVTLDGATQHFNMPKQGQSLLDAALSNQMDAPFACKAEVCSTCRAKVIEGEVDVVTNHTLEDYEVEQGYVQRCQYFCDKYSIGRTI